jgi:probable rRNA maturation factor
MKRAGRSSAPRIPGIVVDNRQRMVSVDIANLQCFAMRALQLCLRLPFRRKSDLTSLTEIHVVLISNRRMAELHHRFLRIGGPTDVITFQHGEICVSVQAARRQALAFGSSPLREIELYIVHGLLHLHGYDDQTLADARRMDVKQKQILCAASSQLKN